MSRIPTFRRRAPGGVRPGVAEHGGPSRRVRATSTPQDAQGTASGQEGFTLAALIVILTIISIVIAYTVPTQWSLIMRRERERQTIFLMKQYARGIEKWQRKHQGLPVSLEQLQEAKQPRMLRGTGKWANPLTGQEDGWILVPPTAVQAIPGAAANVPQQRTGTGNQQPSAATPGGAPQTPGKLDPDASPKDYVGPFVAVRPNATGPSLMVLNGAEDYSQWVYTLLDLQNERAMRQGGAPR